MEPKWLTSPELRITYERLCQRFDEDLSNSRDRMLSKCAVLMLIKFQSETSHGRKYND